MYVLGGSLDIGEVKPGTCILIEGESESGTYDLILEILAQGNERGEGSVMVLTENNAETFLNDYRSLNVEVDSSRIGVVDSISRQGRMRDMEETETIKYASSPSNLTQIGTKFTQVLKTIHEEKGVERNRVGLHTVSTFLIYLDVQEVYRFLHVFVNQIKDFDGLGLLAVNPSRHDEKTINMFRSLSDGYAKVSGDELDTSEIQVRGSIGENP